MTLENRRAAALTGLRILDLAGPMAWYGTRMLAGLGADVLRIEPPGGDPARRKPPFAHDTPGPESSLSFAWYNAGKRSAIIDLDSAPGQAAIRRLAAQADAILESFPAGWLAERGLGYADLAAANPGLVMTSVTPFGQTGPRASWRGTDSVGLATGGLIQLSGNQGSPPTHIGGEQGYLHAGLVAAAATLVALRGRDASGQGQQVDISLQDTIVACLENTIGIRDLFGLDRARIGGIQFTGDPMFYRTKDGWVTIGKVTRRWSEFLAWLDEGGVPNDHLRSPEWFDSTFADKQIPAVTNVIRQLAAGSGKLWFFESAQRHRFGSAPVATVADLTEDTQLLAREFWLEVEGVLSPGAPFKMSRTPWAIRRPAPAPGQHSAEGWLAREAPHEVGQRPAASSNLPLAGIRVVDLSWMIAGPGATQVLADHGADVIRVETSTHPDSLRMMSIPRPPWSSGLNTSGIFCTINSSKRSIALNLTTEEGRDILRQLLRTADVVVDNYGVDPLPKWGLAPAQMHALRPDLIIARSSVMGRSGPRSHYVGIGATIAPGAGLNALSGFPDDPPVGTCTSHPDYSSNPYHFLVAILAALHHRDRTGEGQIIDLSQHESTAVFNGAAVLDYSVNGRVAGPSANRHPEMAPHGLYPCRGEDRWAAIACESDDDWTRLAHAIGRPDLAADSALASLPGRQARHDELDAAIAAWTRLHTPHEVMELLQAAGVPAGAVQTGSDVLRDPHLAARRKLTRLDHPEIGRLTLNGPSFVLTRTPAGPRRHPPLLGQDTDDVLTGLLAFDEEATANAYVAGAIE